MQQFEIRFFVKFIINHTFLLIVHKDMMESGNDSQFFVSFPFSVVPLLEK